MRDCRWRLPNVLQQLHEEKNWVAEATKELAGRQLRVREEVARIRGCSEKKQLKEEVPQRKCRSVKKSLNKKV